MRFQNGTGPGFVTENYDYTSIYVGNSYSVNDNLTWTHGRHTVKAGVEFRRIQMNQEHPEDGTDYVFLGGESGGERGEKSAV